MEVSMELLVVSSIKAHVVSDDGGQVAVAFAKKDGGELSVMMPTECLDALIAGLNRAKTVARNKRADNVEKVNVTMAKTWTVIADVKMRGAVVLVFDAKTDAQVAYALDAESSKELAAGLIRSAETVLAHKASRAN